MAAKGVSSGPMGRGGRALRSVECALVLVLAATVGWLATRDREREDARFRLEASSSTAAARIHQIEQSTAAAIHDAALLAARAEALAQANGSMIATVHDSVARHDSFLEAQGRTLEELSWRQDSQFHATQANLQDRVDALCARVDHDHDTPVTAEARFRIIQRQADPSVFLVHCTFDYETKDLENEWTRHSATTWGTAFAVTDDGHLVTNK